MNVLVIDDHPLVRKALVSMLSNDNINEIEEASSVKEAISIISKDIPEIALVDLRLGEENGLEIALKAKEINLNTKFIILTSCISKEEFVKAEEIGIDGYLLKDAYPDDILYVVSAISRGRKYYDPTILKQQKDNAENNLINMLTSREKDVLKELEKGLSNEEIAHNLYISNYTVKKHVSSILTKFNLKHRSQIIYYLNNLKIS